MMETYANRKALCASLMEHAAADPSITVLCSDSRGSSGMNDFTDTFPSQFVETGIAEQNLVGMAAGMAACGEKVFAFSPASFLSTRAYEQIKVDAAYSHTNVTLVGVSAGISYGPLGMSHHACQDIAALCALPGMRVYVPSDRYMTEFLANALLQDRDPAYLRLSRSPSQILYSKDYPFVFNQAPVLKQGDDVLLVACGQMSAKALEAARLLASQNISAGVLDMYCLKPFDSATLLEQAETAGRVVTIEEHSRHGGLGSLVCQSLCEHHPMPVLQIALPDGHILPGEDEEVFAAYEMDGAGIARQVANWLQAQKG